MLRQRFFGPEGERGANAVLLAFSMLLLLGMAAVALDLSAGFNERNQDQNAGDNGVMSGAIEKAVGNPNDQLIVNQALAIAQANLTVDFPGGLTDPDWIAMWRSCVDDGNPGWIPLPEPAAWGGGGTLDCISQTTSLLRVRVPDQLIDTTFGAVMGFDSLTTNAVSIAKVALMGGAPPVVPYAVATGSSSGEYCLSSAPSGTAWPPCTGSETGAFGSIISPLFGDFGTHTPECNGNTIRWFERNLVWGLDHRIREWSGASGVAATPSSPWPGLGGLTNINRDDCVLDPSGNPTPVDGIQLNTVRVDTGFPDPGVTNALISDQLFDGRAARLQQPAMATRILMNQNDEWHVDNYGPWNFLTDDPLSPPECHRSTYSGLATEDTALPPDQTKVGRFEICLEKATDVIFTHDISTHSPRFVWTPELVYQLGPGNHFNPVRRFRPSFIAGVWMNCPSPISGKPCGASFYPDEEVTTPICAGSPNCKKVTVDQVSTWILPDTSIPQSVWNAFNAAFDNLEPELFQ